MAKVRVQAAAHFQIDLTDVDPNNIAFPETVTVTLSVGDEFTPEKVPFNIAFTPDQIAKLEDTIKARAIQAQRKAAPASTEKAQSAPVEETATENTQTEAPLFEAF